MQTTHFSQTKWYKTIEKISLLLQNWRQSMSKQSGIHCLIICAIQLLTEQFMRDIQHISSSEALCSRSLQINIYVINYLLEKISTSDFTTYQQMQKTGKQPTSCSSTLLITSQDPDLDTSMCQVSNSFRNSILQFVLDGSRSNKRHSYLDLFVDFRQPFLAVLKSNAATDVNITVNPQPALTQHRPRMSIK